MKDGMKLEEKMSIAAGSVEILVNPALVVSQKRSDSTFDYSERRIVLEDKYQEVLPIFMRWLQNMDVKLTLDGFVKFRELLKFFQLKAARIYIED